MRVVFMGTPDFARTIFEALLDDPGVEVVALFTQPDRPVGRKQILTPPVIVEPARKAGIAIYQPERLDDTQAAIIRDLKPDMIVVAAFGQLVPASILSIAPCINLHTSLLPAYRGASPLQESLLRGDRYCGVTAMLMDEGLDTGDILGKLYLPMPEGATYGCLLEKMGYMASSLLKDILRLWPRLKPLKQHHCDASKVRKRRKEDGIVDFSDALLVYRTYQGLTPWPGIATANGLKLKEISLDATTGSYRHGEILEIAKERIRVGCGTGSLWIERVQPSGKSQMTASSYLHGKRLSVGDLLV